MSWEFGESNVFQNMPKWEPNVQPIIPCHVQDSLQHDLVLVKNFSSSVFVHVLCHVTFQSTKCTGGPHAHIAARSGSHLARDVTSPLPPLHGEASLMVWGSVCTRAQRSHQQWVNYITSHEISWAVWVSCLLTTSAINTWHGTRRLFAMRLNVEAATGRISNSSSEALSKKAIAQTGWDLWGFGATPLFQTNLLSRLRTRKSCVAGPSGETWIIMVHHHVYMLMRMLMFIYIYYFFGMERQGQRRHQADESGASPLQRATLSAVEAGKPLWTQLPSHAPLLTQMLPKPKHVYACIFQDRTCTHTYIYTSQPWASYLPSGCHSLLRELAMTLGIGFLRSRRRPMNPLEAVEMQTKRPGICTWHAVFACVQVYV